MIDFSKALADRQRQNSIWVDNIEYIIKTDFSVWICFDEKISDQESVILKEFDYLYAWKAPDDRAAGFKELMKFYRNEQPLPRPTGSKSGAITLDWKIDSEYIWAAFLERYGINLLEKDMHWHDFLALFNALTGTMINNIMSARNDDSKKGPLLDMRLAWEIRKKSKKPIMKMV